MRTVFLVDDDPGVRRSLSRVLREEGFEVRGYESAEAFLARPDTTARGCIVLDVTMPGLDGLALQRRLSEEGQQMPIVFLTGYGDIPTSVRAIKAGAADFLTKPVASATLVAAVRAAIEQDSVARQTEDEAAELAQRFGSLTAREREVLSALVGGKLNKQIAADLGVVEQTVKFHRARIMERMGARTVAELMHMVAKLGSTRAAQPSAPGLSRGTAATPGKE
ncbi:MAG: Response regulator protein TodT [Accumulibacter sp.]|jgi:FixJ family two-component response regulator|uniref:response regulator transcription factor n=1 Tax=Accumulibacter sp. TaxID=2053492 RepID=UPI001214C7F3|nr:response regulator [Accumulibacter sp.]QKS27525.1 MAG: response regulator transcription factor [Candidatus Accumulibacter similis]TLD46642.1 MAG: Response regulator protein TodT [Accumulibacter sp.]